MSEQIVICSTCAYLVFVEPGRTVDFSGWVGSVDKDGREEWYCPACHTDARYSPALGALLAVEQQFLM